jgi:hypothetical protein
VRAINHALTGAVIGLAVADPLLALPAAVASHFICDMIPHHGFSDNPSDKDKNLRSKLFEASLYADALLCVGLVLVLALSGLKTWFLVSVCAFLAAAPDFLSINHYLKARAHKQWNPGAYTRFASKIQWFERPIGGIVEVAWAIAMITILTQYIG